MQGLLARDFEDLGCVKGLNFVVCIFDTLRQSRSAIRVVEAPEL